MEHVPQWVHEWLDPAGEVVINCGQIADESILQFPGLCEFRVNLQTGQISFAPEPEVGEATIRHLLLDQVIPRVLGQKGRLVLHASAAAISKNNGVAFVGDSGWGKSTIVSSFYDNGARLLTDDCLLLDINGDDVIGIPNYHGLRLYHDSAEAVFGEEAVDGSAVSHYSDKKRLLLQGEQESKQDRSVRLSAIFLLNDPELDSNYNDISIESISGVGEMMTIIRQMFVLDPTDTELMAKQFGLAGNLMQCGIPIFHLRYPRQHSLLADVRRAVEVALQENGVV